MIKSIKIVLVLLAVLLLAACAGTGGGDWNQVCDDPVAVADCRYGGDSDTDSDLGDDDGDNGDSDAEE